MHVSQVAYDRFLIELPPPEPDYQPLADPVELKSVARWLCEFGKMPVLALVARDAWSPGVPHRVLPWVPGDADRGECELSWQPEVGSAAVVLETEDDVRRFLADCRAVSRMALLWSRFDIAKSFMRLAENGDWHWAAEAYARFANAGARVEVQQLIT